MRCSLEDWWRERIGDPERGLFVDAHITVIDFRCYSREGGAHGHTAIFSLAQSSVRCRTDGDRGVAQAGIKSRGALHGTPVVLCRSGSPLRSGLVSLDVSAGLRWKLTHSRKVYLMLYTIAVVLVILWLLGLVTSYTMGGFVHILLVVAIIMILVNVISGRRAL
jgi:hypothetical protein